MDLSEADSAEENWGKLKHSSGDLDGWRSQQPSLNAVEAQKLHLSGGVRLSGEGRVEPNSVVSH